MEEMAEVAARQQATSPPVGIVPVFQQPEDGGEGTTEGTLKSAKARRRGSLSISRFGQVTRSWLLLIHDASASAQ